MITQNERDILTVRSILKYCSRISGYLNRFENDYEQFLTDEMFQDAVCMSISQIGEHAKRLSEEFINSHKEIPWHQVRGLRNMIAHEYEKIEYDEIWEIAVKDIPDLRQFCEEILKPEE